MDELYEMRNRTKMLLRSGSPTTSQYEEALPLCKELWESFSETHELWDAHQYANCLRKLNKLDEAEVVCESVYFDFKDADLNPEQSRPFLYIKNLFAWIINDKYIKTIRQSNYQYATTVLDKLVLLYELIQQNESNVPSFSFCALTTLNQLVKMDTSIDYEKFLYVLNRLDPALLSLEAYQYTDSSGKIRENASQREIFYKLKSDALLKTKSYEECILCCNEAMETLEQFHYNNDIWFARKIAIALGALGNIDEAIKKLEKLIVISDKWFLLYEIGKLYLQLNQPLRALEYMLRAACTKDPEKMKVSLIESLGDLLNELDEKALAQDNYLFARQIRLSNDWAVQDKLNQKIVVEREVNFKEIRNSWIHRLYQLVGSKQGKVNKLFPNKTGGFIQADKPYYFQLKNFFGRGDLLKVGDTVIFIVTASYDRKKQIETEEAMVITPFKKNK
ncbi:MAG: hypothetical protein K2M17_04435 [Bacilli bacterium]|nr:hypothetical protein [Bacilli bacterium]